MRILITGATGFVGTHLAVHCQQRGDQVLGLSRSGQWRFAPWSRVAFEPPEVWTWDLTKKPSPELLEAIRVFQPELIFHLAAISIPADCGLDEPTREAWATNVQGTQRLLELAHQLEGDPPVMLASSCHVYGPPGDNDFVAESAPAQPQNGYGRTKLAAEQLLLESIAARHVRGWIARGFQQTGPWQSARMLLPEWARQFVQRATTVHVRSVQTTLDLMDVRDSVSVYRQMAERVAADETLNGCCLNVGTGLRRRGGEILQALETVASYTPQIVARDDFPHPNPIADTTRLRAHLPNFRCRPLLDTVRDTYQDWQYRLATAQDSATN